MIVKRGEKPDEEFDLSRYIGNNRIVHAKRMIEDFMIETDSGWQTYKKGT